MLNFFARLLVAYKPLPTRSSTFPKLGVLLLLLYPTHSLFVSLPTPTSPPFPPSMRCVSLQMIIVNIQGNGAYHLPQGGVSSPVNAATIKDFIDGYKAGSLERFQLSRG